MIVEASKNRPVNIGRLGENEARIIKFPVGDMQKEFPGCYFAVLNKRKNDPSAYPVPASHFTVEFDCLYWTVMSGDVAQEGNGECQIVAILDSKIMKSDIYMTVVGRALDGTGTPPDPWAAWVEDVADAVRDAEAYALGTRDGTPVGETDPTYHNNSKYYSEQTEAMLSTKADKENPVFTGALSKGRGGTAGAGSFAFGANVQATQTNSFAIGENSRATGKNAVAENYNCNAGGKNSHAEGNTNTASAENSHAEGNSCNIYASAMAGHAEGYHTSVRGVYGHAEGSDTVASGVSSHAQGGQTTASGNYSDAGGRGTVANHLSQHTFGEYNVADPSEASSNARGNYVEIVGNGTANNARSNARTLDWDGNEELAGDLVIKKGTADEVSVGSLKTEINSGVIEENLLRSEMPGTSTTVTMDSNGNPTSIVHTANSETVRTDSFVWSTNSVVETRTLASGKYITITTNLETLAQTISAVQEVA